MTSRLVVKVEGTTLTEPFDVSWTDPLNNLGRGEFSLFSDDAQASLPSLGDVVTIDKDGVSKVFSFIVEQIRKVDVDSGEASGQIKTFAGRSLAAELERITVYPPFGLITSTSGQTSGKKVSRSPWADDRLFGWPDPVRGALLSQTPTAADNVTLMTGANQPVGWPDSYCYKVGKAAGATTAYFVARISETDSTYGRVLVFVNASDECELYWNGVLILQILASEADPTKTHRVSLEVTPGQPQILSARVRKNTSANALFACAVHEVGSTLNFLLRTRGPEQDWGMLTDPSYLPGITPGEIIDQILVEATARGVAHGWTTSFTASEDSNGTPWPNIPIWPEQIGTSLTSVLDRLGSSWIDWGVRPGDGRVLSAWIAAGVDLPGGGTGVGRGTASGITGAVGTNALELVHEVTG